MDDDQRSATLGRKKRSNAGKPAERFLESEHLSHASNAQEQQISRDGKSEDVTKRRVAQGLLFAHPPTMPLRVRPGAQNAPAGGTASPPGTPSKRPRTERSGKENAAPSKVLKVNRSIDTDPDKGDRMLVIKCVLENSMTATAITRQFTHLKKSFVWKWAMNARKAKKNAAGATVDVEQLALDAPRAGRPRMLDTKQQRKLRKAINKQRGTTPGELAPRFNCTTRTLQRECRRIGLKPFKGRFKPRITEKQKRFRLQWAKHHKKARTDFKKWVFSDEKWFFMVCESKNQVIWCDQDEMTDAEQPAWMFRYM